MQKERFKIIPASYLVLRKDSKILLSRRFNTGYEDGNYSMVAGHVEKDETYLSNVVKEAKEEANITIRQEDLKFVHAMYRNTEIPDKRYLDMYFECSKWKGNIKNIEPGKCDDISWFDINNLPENMIPSVRYALECILKNKPYSEF